jgi:hypothetical protein
VLSISRFSSFFEIGALTAGAACVGQGLTQVVAALHPLDAALSVNHSLLARIEGVAFAAHLYPKRGLGGPGVKHVAAGARHRGIVKVRVDFCFHFLTDLSF